jgi:translation elongation factor EF-4
LELTGAEFAYEACASMGFDEACRAAEPILLEPIMAVTLVSPKEFVGDVMSLVTQRGGAQVESMDSRPDTDQVKALAPMAKMFGFMTSLRSVSQGAPLLPWNSPISRKGRMLEKDWRGPGSSIRTDSTSDITINRSYCTNIYIKKSRNKNVLNL